MAETNGSDGFADLRQDDNTFRWFFDDTIVGHCFISGEKEIIANEAFAKMLGYTTDELRGRKWTEITYADDIPDELVRFNRIQHDKKPIHIIKRYVRKDKTVMWADVYASFGPDKTQKAYLTSVVDITDLVRTKHKLETSEAIHICFLDSSSDSIFLKDENLRYLLVNKALASGINRSKEEIIGKNDYQLLDQAAARNCESSDRKALASIGPYQNEEILADHIHSGPQVQGFS